MPVPWLRLTWCCCRHCLFVVRLFSEHRYCTCYHPRGANLLFCWVKRPAFQSAALEYTPVSFWCTQSCTGSASALGYNTSSIQSLEIAGICCIAWTGSNWGLWIISIKEKHYGYSFLDFDLQWSCFAVLCLFPSIFPWNELVELMSEKIKYWLRIPIFTHKNHLKRNVNEVSQLYDKSCKKKGTA